MIFGKLLVGGLLMFVIVGCKEIMESFEVFVYLFIIGVNFVSCEVVLVMIKMIEDEDLLNVLWKKGSYVRKRIDLWIECY